MTRNEAADLVQDLVLATREFERRSGDRYYREQFEEQLEKVIAALAVPSDHLGCEK